MNPDSLKGKWHHLKGAAKTTWGTLTDDELERASSAEVSVGRSPAST